VPRRFISSNLPLEEKTKSESVIFLNNNPPISEFGERLFDHLPGILFFVKDREGRFIDGNPALVKKLGAPNLKAVIGQCDEAFIPRYLSEAYRTDDLRVLAGETILDKVELLTSRGGIVDWYITTKIPLRNTDGDIVAVAGMTRDYSGAPDFHTGTPLSPAIEEIRMSFGSQLRVPELAKKCGLSVSAFERRFRRDFHLTPTEYVRKVRIHEACRQLLHSDRELAEIAYDSGFSDQSHFTREFRRVMGTSPGTYRNSHGRD